MDINVDSEIPRHLVESHHCALSCDMVQSGVSVDLVNCGLGRGNEVTAFVDKDEYMAQVLGENCMSIVMRHSLWRTARSTRLALI